MKKLYFYLTLILISSCADEVDVPESELYEVRDIGQLSTTEYTVGKIIKLDDSDIDLSDFELSEFEWPDLDHIPKIGDRKILISCKAKIKAGVDLSKIKEGDIKVNGTTIEIILPPAEITSFTMDPNSVRTEMENVNGLRQKFTQKEKTEFLKQGEESIKEDMNNTDILKDANDNAEAILIDYYKQLGFKEIIVQRSKEKE